jgi:hypothetical protein
MNVIMCYLQLTTASAKTGLSYIPHLYLAKEKEKNTMVL